MDSPTAHKRKGEVGEHSSFPAFLQFFYRKGNHLTFLFYLRDPVDDDGFFSAQHPGVSATSFGL